MIFVEGLEDVEDLWLMSICKYNVTSNSSFSWWGAWINGKNDKKVISPKDWYGDYVNINTDDYTPKDWIKI